MSLIGSVRIVFCCRMTIHSQQHVLVMWALAFYIRENYIDEIKDSDFSVKFFQVCDSFH